MSVITRVIKFLRVGVGISNTDVEYAESTSLTTAPTEGWQTTAPQWRKGYYIWSRTHFYYTDGSEKVSTPMCHGAAGKDAINIQLSMSTIVHKKSQFVGSYSIDVQAFEAGMEKGCIVSCDLTKDTTGVSMRSVKYKKGRRLLITIEKNTIVNDALNILVGVDGISYTYKVPIITVEDGEPGAKGETGATLRGPQSWSNCGNGYSFQAGAAGEEWKDAVIYNSGYYSCIKSHVKSATNYPGSDEDTNNGYWRLGSPIELVVANIILSQFQIVENLGVRTIEMKDKDGNVVFKAKDGDLYCKGGNFENITATGNFKSRNEKTWNEIEMNADKGYLVMRGPTSVNDDNWDLPSSIAKMTDLFKVKFESDADSLSRIATMDIFGYGGKKRVNIDPELGFRIFSNEGTDEESHLILGKDTISYTDGLGHVYQSDWNSLLKKIL